MVRGVGLDLCETARMRRACALEAFAANVFTEGERAFAGPADKPACFAHLAAAFAAKEAFSKAVGTGFRTFQPADVEVVHNEAGAPSLRLAENARKALEAAGGRTVFLSLTHEKEMAAAVVVIEG